MTDQRKNQLAAFLIRAGEFHEAREDDADARGGIPGEMNRLASSKTPAAPPFANLGHLFPAQFSREVERIEVSARERSVFRHGHHCTRIACGDLPNPWLLATLKPS